MPVNTCAQNVSTVLYVVVPVAFRVLEMCCAVHTEDTFMAGEIAQC
jgi:hypothetical protein